MFPDPTNERCINLPIRLTLEKLIFLKCLDVTEKKKNVS